MGLEIHPTKGHFFPILIGEHLGMKTDNKTGLEPRFSKLEQIAVMAKPLMDRGAAHTR